MNTNGTIRAIALAALVAVPAAATYAAGPFQVRRATTGQAVRTAPPVAIIATAPYDEDSATRASASDYYYGVYDAAGNALTISVQTNPVTNGIRIGFDDGNGTSAPVNANSSSVVVAPASIRADGLQTASITIAPRDANGVLLGRGLSVSVDTTLLWPAHLSGAINDRGDGTYTALAVASVPGAGTVRVTVEGTALAPNPTITATAVDPNASLRDLAIAQLRDLIGAGGPLATLQDAAGPRSSQSRVLGEVLGTGSDALSTLVNDDLMRDDNVLKGDFDVMVSQLAFILDAPGSLSSLDVLDAMNDLLDVAKLIAEYHIDRASEACGVCDGSGHPMKVCNAVDAMAQADEMRTLVSPDWGAIADAYARAVEWALQAFHLC